jgi:hypothetical protein
LRLNCAGGETKIALGPQSRRFALENPREANGAGLWIDNRRNWAAAVDAPDPPHRQAARATLK